MKGVIVHEWIEEIGGSENVLDKIAQVFPDAPIYCLWNDAPHRFEPGRVKESWLAKTPLRKSKPLALLFMPFVWRRMKINFQPSWILASSHLFAHHVKFRGVLYAPKFAYVHSPARYIWSPELDQRGKSVIVRIISPLLKYVDKQRAKELFSIATNSRTVQKRVAKYWNRDAEVIYPPVDTEYFNFENEQLSLQEVEILDELPPNFVLGASRFVSYKRLDLAIKYAKVTQTALVLAGDGPGYSELLEIKEKVKEIQIWVVKGPSNEMLKALYRRAKVLVFGAIEDFGIMPVEAMSCGTPVIGNVIGGVSESVLDGVTGKLLNDFSCQEIIQADQIIEGISSQNCVDRARTFGLQRFETQLKFWIENSAEV